MSKSGIYAIRHPASGKLYVGSAKNIDARWKIHTRRLDRGEHANPKLQAAWNKYGADAFLFEILEECPIESLIVHEQYYIDALHPFYNVAPTAGSQLGFKHSPASRAKIGAALAGKLLTVETKQKMSEAKLGKKHKPETIVKMSVAKIGKKMPPRTDSHRKNIAIAATWRVASKETRGKLSLIKTGIKLPPRSPEHLERLRSAMKGNTNSLGAKRSPATLAKMSAWQKGIPRPERRGIPASAQKREKCRQVALARWARARAEKETQG